MNDSTNDASSSQADRPVVDHINPQSTPSFASKLMKGFASTCSSVLFVLYAYFRVAREIEFLKLIPFLGFLFCLANFKDSAWYTRIVSSVRMAITLTYGIYRYRSSDYSSVHKLFLNGRSPGAGPDYVVLALCLIQIAHVANFIFDKNELVLIYSVWMIMSGTYPFILLASRLFKPRVSNNAADVVNEIEIIIYPPAETLRPKLDIIIYDPAESNLKKEDASCSICLSEFENKDNLSHPSCKHIFHYVCLKKWGSQKLTCPLCMAPIPIEQSSSEETLTDIQNSGI